MTLVSNNINNLNNTIYIMYMERLALTCKILYDKDWLDNMKLCKDGQVNQLLNMKAYMIG